MSAPRTLIQVLPFGEDLRKNFDLISRAARKIFGATECEYSSAGAEMGRRFSWARLSASRAQRILQQRYRLGCVLTFSPAFLGGGDERCGEFLVKGEEVFDALALVLERLRAVAEVNRSVEVGVGFDQRWRHR